MASGILTIDLSAIVRNWCRLDAMSSNAVETGAVVKADAYGLGIEPVAKALAKSGAKSFFVADVQEAAPLRNALGSEPKIYVFAGLMAGDEALFQQTAAIPVLNSIEQVRRFKGSGLSVQLALQFDSGMNRLGLEPADLALSLFDLTGVNPDLVLSHLACADEAAHPMNAVQLGSFATMAAAFPSARKSFAATGGIQLGAGFHFDLTRPGVGLYGGDRFTGAEPVVNLSLPVIQIRDLLPGEIVGYGATWQASRPTKIATVASGYADGIFRMLGGQGLHLYSQGIACPLRGRVSMDTLTIDITDLDHVPTSLELLNDIQTVNHLAEMSGTISYEILTSLGARYQRVYTGA